jgi:uncharacterized protein (DUF169 family)
MRFCEAVTVAKLKPVLLSKENISCPSALYSFGWEDKLNLVKYCGKKRTLPKNEVEELINFLKPLDDSINYIGLNTDEDPDLVISYLSPEQAMRILRIYFDKRRLPLNFDILPVMSVCGGVVVRSFLEDKISLSFGCEDSRRYGNIGRDRLIIGIPKSHFEIFLG